MRSAFRAVLARLVSLNFGPVLRHRMTMGNGGAELLGLHVVKVVVPRCETLLSPHPRMGPRLLARVVGQAS